MTAKAWQQKTNQTRRHNKGRAKAAGLCDRRRVQKAAGLPGHFKVQRVPRQRYHTDLAGYRDALRGMSGRDGGRPEQPVPEIQPDGKYGDVKGN